MSVAYYTGSWSTEGQATHREISQRSGGIRGHLDLFVLPENCMDRSVGRTCEWCDTREAAIESALLGIRRELDQWQPWEHRCWTIGGFAPRTVPRCSTCGAWSVLHVSTWRAMAHLDFQLLFDWSFIGDDTWHARPGTSITRGTK